MDLCSNVVYMYTCSQCGLRYVGSTSRWFSHRYLEHKGLSIRTKRPLTRPSHSAIRDHSLDLDHPFTHKDFETLFFASNRIDLLISESLLIKKMGPELNNYSSAFQLALWTFSQTLHLLGNCLLYHNCFLRFMCVCVCVFFFSFFFSELYIIIKTFILYLVA